MTLSLKASVAMAACNSIVAQADIGTTNPTAKFVIYKGTMPANVEAALGGALPLVEMPMATPAFKPAVDNTVDGFADAVANPVAEVAATGDGTATFYRLFNRDNVAIWQGTVTEPNLGGDMELSSLTVIAGINVVVQSFTIRMPK